MRRLFFPKDVQLKAVEVGGQVETGARALILSGEMITVIDGAEDDPIREQVTIDVILPPGAAGRLGEQMVADQIAEIVNGANGPAGQEIIETPPRALIVPNAN